MIEELKVYKLQCDNCKIQLEFLDITMFNSIEQANSVAISEKWYIDDKNKKYYCNKCWEYYSGEVKSKNSDLAIIINTDRLNKYNK